MLDTKEYILYGSVYTSSKTGETRLWNLKWGQWLLTGRAGGSSGGYFVFLFLIRAWLRFESPPCNAINDLGSFIYACYTLIRSSLWKKITLLKSMWLVQVDFCYCSYSSTHSQHVPSLVLTQRPLPAEGLPSGPNPSGWFPPWKCIARCSCASLTVSMAWKCGTIFNSDHLSQDLGYVRHSKLLKQISIKHSITGTAPQGPFLGSASSAVCSFIQHHMHYTICGRLLWMWCPWTETLSANGWDTLKRK